MGGSPPLGYDVVARKLVVNEAEAKLIRHIFAGFLKIGSATLLVKELTVAGYRSKSWTTQGGRERLGRPLNKNNIYKMLNNRLYLGEAVHKGAAYPGEHEAIIDAATWDKVCAVLADKAPRVRAGASRSATPAPLKGLIHCGHCGRAMTPTYTRKTGRLYRYYTCMQAIRSGHGECPVRSVAAGEIEAAVISQVRALLKAPEILARVERMADGVAPSEVRKALKEFDALWDELFPAEQARILELLVEKVAVHHTDVELKLRIEGLASLVADITAQRGRKAA